MTGMPMTRAVLDAIARGCPETVADQVADALTLHVVNGIDLETALGLDRVSRIRARNEALQEAAAVLSDGSPSAWETARRLADAVRRFESRVWPRCRRNPDGLGPVDSALRIAHLTGERVPSSPKRLLQFTDTNAVQRP